jgi:hypothetical protein
MYSHTFQRWKSLHEALTGLVQDYRDTCVLLQSECAQLPRSPADRAYLENAMSTLNSKLALIHLSEGQLLESRIVLQRIRNRSHLVAINSLPDEILAYVFALANCHCYYDSENRYEPCQYGMSSPSVLAGVCQRWRRLAIGTPLLWSHIDLNLGGNEAGWLYQRAKLWLERALGAPLYIRVWELDGTEIPYHLRIKDWDIEALLAPCVQQFSVLDLVWEDHRPILEFIVIRMWLEKGSPSSVKSLMLSCSDTPSDYDPDSQLKMLTPRICLPDETSKPLLQAVSSLSLDNMYIPLAVQTFHGLLNLELRSASVSNSDFALSTFGQVIAENPQLRSLTIEDLDAECRVHTAIDPVQLEHLEILNLHTTSPGPVLSVLAPKSRALSLSFTLPNEETHTKELLAFLSRTGVSTLRLQPISSDRSHYQWLSVICSPHTRVSRLALVNFTFPDGLCDLFSDFAHLVAPLPSLYLVSCNVRSDLLRQILVARSVQSLHIWSCRLDGSIWPDNAGAEVQETIDALKEVVPRIVLYPADEARNPVRSWSEYK